MKVRLVSLSICISLLNLFSSCSSSKPATVAVLTGCVKDNFSIKFLEKDIELMPNNFFNIKNLGLVENSCNAGHLVPGGYRTSGVTYKISIVHNNKMYYGRIGFFKVAEECKGEGVASFYRIALPEKSFTDANDGSQSCWGEYTIGGGYKMNTWTTLGGGNKRPTWIIWLSDTQIF
ncbi:MAG: hypothetical protein WCP65_05485 [Bacteroidota bacterium]